MADQSFFEPGDKFVIEIGEAYWTPSLGNRYFIKGFNSLVFDDYGLSKLTRYKDPKDVPHNCKFCKHKAADAEDYPCSICDKGVERRDLFEAE